VFHYTAENEADSLRILQDPNALVSSHYLVGMENIYQLVDLDKRAYHAGYSYWQGRHGLNDTSIGIEIVQEVSCDAQTKTCDYPPYPMQQIDNLITVLSEIKQRHPNIKATAYVGHQDIAPARKQDPGPLFPWQYLAEQGFGAWYETDDYQAIRNNLAGKSPSQARFYQGLALYGYPEITDDNAEAIIRAFQTHFTPEEITGQITPASYAALMALLKKYKPRQYQQLMTEPNLL
ncbi:MAG: N-acetylmuramoyl-L-alanine amidase, partial [Vibrio sp.]